MEKLIETIGQLTGVFGFILGVANIIAANRERTAKAKSTDADAAKKLSDTAAGIAGTIETHVINKLEIQLTAYADRIDRLEILTAHQEQLINEQGHKIAEQDITIKEQGGIIMQLRQRVSDLEHENGNLRKENDQLKQRGGKL